MQEIFPCPFCGSTNLELFRADRNYNWDDETFHGYYTMRCMKCDARGPITEVKSTDGRPTDNEAYLKAAQIWNNRKEES